MKEGERITEFTTSLHPADILIRLFRIQRELGASSEKLTFPELKGGGKDSPPEIGYVFFGEEKGTGWCVQIVADECFGRCNVFISAVGSQEFSLEESIIKADLIAERLREA